jgi:predicted nucleotidyltransferase
MNEQGVRFVLIGGYAAILHGSRLLTEDIDACAPLDQENLGRILGALKDTRPRFRMRPDRMPVPDDAARLAGFRNLNLETDFGIVDILGEVTGIGGYEEVLRHSEERSLGGQTFRILTLDALIIAKRAAGRRKDVRGVEELERIKRSLEGPPELTQDTGTTGKP